MEPKERIIVALDTRDPYTAREWAETLKGEVGGFKIGLELITGLLAEMIACGNGEAEQVLIATKDLFGFLGKDIFWDGKLHDIPNTIKGAADAITMISPKYFNVHASAGIAAIRAAADVKRDSKLLVVTVLTSIDEEECNLIYGAPSKVKVIQFARNAKLAGADGLICSPQEISILRQRQELNDLILVTPGVRPNWASVGDQKRVMTPGEAIKAGATALVIGRPITKPPAEIGTPLDAVRRIVEEIVEAA